MAWTQSTENEMRKLFAEDPQWKELARQTSRKFRTGEIPAEMLSILTQTPTKHPGLVAYGLMAQMLVPMMTGQILGCQILVGSSPVADKEVDENRWRLSNLPPPFETDVWCGTEGEDGALYWTDPITLGPVVSGAEGEIVLEPNRAPAPLEIGATDASRTFLHFTQEQSIARWPYGSDRITLLWVVDPELWTMNWLLADS